MQKLVEGLHRFQSEFCRSNQDLFERLSQGQNPEALFISCSDSRVIPNLITQTGPGELFVLRNAGNIIPPHGSGGVGEMATIEFAVTALGVKDIVVCGHTLCGAMRGLLELEKLDSMPAVKSWLSHAESTRRIITENYAHLEGNPRLTATVQENVLVQIENLRTHPSVRSKLLRGDLAIHAWVYKIETGEVFAYDQERGQFMPFGGTISANQPPLSEMHKAAS
jgi:carbonic anhydrase